MVIGVGIGAERLPEKRAEQDGQRLLEEGLDLAHDGAMDAERAGEEPSALIAPDQQPPAWASGAPSALERQGSLHRGLLGAFEAADAHSDGRVEPGICGACGERVACAVCTKTTFCTAQRASVEVPSPMTPRLPCA